MENLPRECSVLMQGEVLDGGSCFRMKELGFLLDLQKLLELLIVISV